MSQLSAIQQELDDPTDGIRLHATRKHVHATWARTFSSVPELYFQPESVEEVQKILRLAHQCRRRVVTTGSGHSPSHLTCTSHWLVNLDKLDAILETDETTNQVRVQAGIRLRDLCAELDKRDLDMRNLGSINEQSVAGVIATGTHGSSLSHGLVSQNVLGFKIVIADGSIKECSESSNNELYRAGLISLGALGIIVEVTYQAVPNFRLHWRQTIDSDRKLFSQWGTKFWSQGEFIRVWWLPHARRAITWSADRTDEPDTTLPYSFFDGPLGYYLYHNLLYLGHWFPSILPWVEKFVFGMQYSFTNGTTTSAVQPSRKALLLNCLYSQYVNEWALPLEKGPEALRRLSTWLNNISPDDPDYMEPGIPFTNRGIFVHAPLEVRVTNSVPTTPEEINSRPFLDSSEAHGPTLYLNATLYRPYYTDPVCRQEYYEAFEYLMRDLGGRPHWAKNFLSDKSDLEEMYGENLQKWRRVREEVDPDGMFVGPWHREKVVDGPLLPLEETTEEGDMKKDSMGARRMIGKVRE